MKQRASLIMMRAKIISDYDEWEYKYKVTWKGYADETEQGVQDLVAAESLVEEYWADPDTGVKKWKRLRPKLDNMKQQMEMLKSQDQISKANIKIAGVQLRQAIGKSKEQVYKVYKRLEAKEIRTTDVFHVVLDVKVTREQDMTKKEKAKVEAGGKCKMIIPVKWTWNKLQSVCRKDQVTDIRNGLAQAAKQSQHTHWTKDYKDMATMGGAINPSREEFLVISTEKVICRIEEAGEQAKRQRHRLDQWSTQEQKTLAGVKDEEQHEAWLEVKRTHRIETDAIATRKINEEAMMPKKAQCIDPVEQDKTEDAAMTSHFSQEQDKTEDAAMAPHLSQEQDKTEDAAMTSHLSQDQDKTEEAMMPKKAQCIDKTKTRRKMQ